jgi:hypothetical protein
MSRFPSEDPLYGLKSHPLYEDFEALIKGYRPVIPAFDPSDPSSERWKYESGKQAGFDLVLSLLKIEV